ncbi:MAG: hypothetical protein QOD12_2449, partial [Verrucomicrobiota bacterium]
MNLRVCRSHESIAICAPDKTIEQSISVNV